ncbi:MAG TPA: YetF domain-containing protein [Bacteroidia bacterium]
MHIGYDILNIVGRTTVVYLAIVLGLLLFGKKELSQISVTDLVFILLISNSVQNAMVGSDSSLLGGLVAAAALFSINFLFRKFSYKFTGFRKVLEGEPVMLIYEGNLHERHMQKEGITMEELMAALREHGVESIGEVKLAMLEIDGNISVVSKEMQGKTHHKRKKRSRGFVR